MPRIVSLIASATEIVCALGFEEQLVGRSHECDHPPSVKRLPQVSRPLFPVSPASSRAIDLAVKERLRMALSIYEVDAELLRRLRPDVIITQTQCAVCAVTPGDVERAACDLAGREVRIVSLEPNRLGDVWADIQRVGAALGATDRAADVVDGLRDRVVRIGLLAQTLRPRPRVAVVEWIEPLMAAGNWMPELVEIAGGVSLFGEAGKHSPWMTWEDLMTADPDVLVVSPCGFEVPRTQGEMAVLAGRPEWLGLGAVRRGRVFLADGNAYFHRPGPRLVESLEILCEMLHPGEFDFGHAGKGWVPFTTR
jgi:iron complex transport system substrate-binding protein